MRAGTITWQLAQTFWVGGLWLLQFVVLPGLERTGLAPLLIQEVATGLRPLMVGLAACCLALQVAVLVQVLGPSGLWRDVRGQLLLASAALAAIHLGLVVVGSQRLYWLFFSYVAMGLCGLMLVLQPLPGREPG